MIINKLVLYCNRLDQAILWEVCKRRRCATSNCVFKKISKHFGESLWSRQPIRIATIKAAEENLDKLSPLPIQRTPVLAEPKLSDIAAPVSSRELPPAEKRAPIFKLPNEMLAKDIENMVKASK